jgi:hypothetical protein
VLESGARLGCVRGCAGPPSEATERATAGLGGGQGSLCARRDHPALFLGDHGHDAHGHPIGRGHVTGDEVDAGLLQSQEEVCIAGEAIELGYYQDGAMCAAER